MFLTYSVPVSDSAGNSASPIKAAMQKKIFGKRSAIRRALDKLDTAYCVVMGTVIELGIRFGLWEYVPEDED